MLRTTFLLVFVSQVFCHQSAAKRKSQQRMLSKQDTGVWKVKEETTTTRSDWLTGWCEFSGPITEQSEANPKTTWLVFRLFTLTLDTEKLL